MEPDYGKVLVFTFPKQKLIYGPEQIESRSIRIRRSLNSSRSWDQGGSKVIRGTLLVIPVLNPCFTSSRFTSPPSPAPHSRN